MDWDFHPCGKAARPFREFSILRTGLAAALTTDLDEFLAYCDPGKDRLCLSVNMYDESWAVTVPPRVLDVPPELNGPAPGFIFKRDANIPLSDWLLRIALQCDTLLKSVASHTGPPLDKDTWDLLFTEINKNPIVKDVERNLVRLFGGNESLDEEVHDEACMSCSGLRNSEFLIKCHKCHKCGKWFHGDCLQITPSMAARMKKYKCPYCRVKRHPLAVDKLVEDLRSISM